MHLVMASMRSSTTADSPLDREEYDPISATMDCFTVALMRRPTPDACFALHASVRATVHTLGFCFGNGLRARQEEW